MGRTVGRLSAAVVLLLALAGRAGAQNPDFWPTRILPPGNATTNITMFGTTAISTGTGLSGLGIPRVTVSSDSSMTVNPGTGTFSFTGSVTQGAAGSTPWLVRLSNEHVKANSPFAFRLSNGLGFYDTVRAAQLPATLDASGFLKVHEQGTTTITGTVNQGTQTAFTANAWWVRLTDGGLNSAVIEPGATPAAVGDAALVVGLSPNSPLPAGTSTLGSVKITDGVTVPGVIAATTALKTDLSSVAGTATATAAAGVPKVGIVGNAGAAVDAANNSAAPANVLSDGAQLQSGATATVGTAGQVGSIVAGLDHVLYARLGGPVFWQKGLTAIGATLTEIKAVTAAGVRSYITDITVISDTATAGQFTLRYGTGSNCATGTTTLFPFVAAITAGKIPYPGNTASQPVNYSFLTPLQPAAANAVCVICIATQTCTITMQGYDAP